MSTVVAIDGPAGVGKSTVARRVAAALALPYLDTGAMYRAVALAALDRGLAPDDAAAVEVLIRDLDLALVPDGSGVASVRLGGEPVESRIRSEAVSEAASKVASHPAVRRRLVEIQREFGAAHGAVLEGRDIGTVVFPDTPHKFFLDAAEGVRAQRRSDQLRARGEVPSGARVAADLARRDRRDRERVDSPLTYDDSYTRIDTTPLAIDQVVGEVLRRVRGG